MELLDEFSGVFGKDGSDLGQTVKVLQAFQ